MFDNQDDLVDQLIETIEELVQAMPGGRPVSEKEAALNKARDLVADVRGTSIQTAQILQQRSV